MHNRCGRCRRADLALNGLRIMLLQKKAENNTKPLINEVGKLLYLSWYTNID